MTHKSRTSLWALCLCIFAAASSARAELFIPSAFSDHMVLQRDKPVAVWGGADPGISVTVNFAGQAKKAKADAEGRWRVELDAMEASSTGRTLSIMIGGKPTVIEAASEPDAKVEVSGAMIEFDDVLVGEVWICSGQSNMQWTVANSKDFPAEQAAANHPGIRMFLTEMTTAAEPARYVRGSWKVCTPENVGAFSAAGYFFGRDLHKELGVPIGLIRTAWGGTRSEAWTSKAALEAEPAAKPLLADWASQQENFDPKVAQERYAAALKKWEEAVAKIKEANKTLPADKKKRFPRKPALAGEPKLERHHPSTLYNGMIAPFVGYGIRGAIWYQGESNRERAVQYRDIFPALISDWRAQWNLEFPFYFVQLANFLAPSSEPGVPDSWAELQDAQTLTLKRLPHTGMAVANDIGNAKDIHPKNKQEVGRRLALWALAKDYGKKDIVYSGPIYAGHEVRGGKVRVTFDHIGDGLKSRDGGELKRFETAGKDQVWHWAKAEIDGDAVVVSSPDVAEPAAVRYAWAANPEGANLVNSAGLPASLFRTDDWEMKTDGVLSPFSK